MGTYLSKPNTEKESNEGEDEQFKFGVSAMQGWRVSMEDAHAIVMDVPDAKGKHSNIGFFGVFDGHGGKEVALYAAKYLAPELVRTDGWRKGNLEEAIQQAYMNLDACLSREDTWDELSKFAAEKKAGAQISDEMESEGHENLPTQLRNALAAHYAAIDETNGFEAVDPNWDGDDFDDPPFDPMVALEEGKAEDLGDMDVMTRDDSDDEEERGSGDLDQEDASSEDSGDKASSSNSEDGPGLHANPLGGTDSYRGPSAGCTAVVALIANDLLIVANAGDSRCIASRNGVAHAMTHDHKPTDELEAKRIKKAGGWVTEGRVNGSLNLSRAFGDMEFKRVPDLTPAEQMITADPDVRTLKLLAGDEFLILACDGIWDVLSNQEAVDFVREHLQKGLPPKTVCEAMCDHCLAPDADGCGEGCDNMSAMIVVLKKFASPETLQGSNPIPPPMPPPAP